jgi:hypothetical protein
MHIGSFVQLSTLYVLVYYSRNFINLMSSEKTQLYKNTLCDNIFQIGYGIPDSKLS